MNASLPEKLRFGADQLLSHFMLHNLGEEIRLCYEHAEECARYAQAVTDEKLRADYLRLEDSWLKLARSYELRQRLEPFSNEISGRQDVPSQRTRTADGSDQHETEWQPVASAPFHLDLQLAVIDYCGVHSLVFPCRRVPHGWIKAENNKSIDLSPTHWRAWRETT